MIVLSVGATGSIGTHVVDQAVAAGHIVRALVRNPSRAHLPAAVAIPVGDVTKPETLVAAVSWGEHVTDEEYAAAVAKIS